MIATSPPRAPTNDDANANAKRTLSDCRRCYGNAGNALGVRQMLAAMMTMQCAMQWAQIRRGKCKRQRSNAVRRWSSSGRCGVGQVMGDGQVAALARNGEGAANAMQMAMPTTMHER